MGRLTGFDKAYNDYMQSSAWREKANERMKIDKGICCVCGRKATEVHHLTYDHFGNEQMEDLVSLCHECHEEAENIYYNPSVVLPWPGRIDEMKKIGEYNFMAAMRVDAEEVSQVVFDYLIKTRGSDFDSLWKLRQPTEEGKKDYWEVLRKAVNALCRKRYSKDADDRKDISMRMITNHTIVSICMAVIEHNNRNFVQAQLQDSVYGMYEIYGKWAEVARQLGIPDKTVAKLKKDDGASSGPTLREYVLYYCGLDAVAGIRPMKGFPCLTSEDYETLNNLADYMIEATGIEFKEA